MALTAEAIDKIVTLKKPEKISVGNIEYILQGNTYKEAVPPMVDLLTCHTLTGIVDFVSENIDSMSLEQLMLHIAGHDHVRLITSASKDYRHRETFISSVKEENSFNFGSWYPLDEFIISLNSEFVDNDDKKYLQALVASLTHGSSKNLSDNGVTQTTTVKSGVSFVGEHQIKNPLALKPYRTFLEVDQPESEFLFRIKKNQRDEDGLPLCALFEADGGAWKLEAIQRIKSYFKAFLPQISVIA